MEWFRFLRRKPYGWQEAMEERLQQVFPPKKPREAFRAHLKAQLLAHMPATVEVQPRHRRPDWASRALWIAVGLAGALTLVVNGVRLVLSILAALGLWQQARKQLQEQERMGDSLRPA